MEPSPQATYLPVPPDIQTERCDSVIVNSSTALQHTERAHIMARKSNTTSVDQLIDPTFETNLSAAVVDHETQVQSWQAPEDAVIDAISNQLDREEQADRPEYDHVLENLDSDLVDTTVFKIADALDARAAFQLEKDPDNAKIQATIKKARQQMVTKRAARVLIAANVDVAFFNRSVHTGSRYNVYALGKLGDLVVGLTNGGVIANAVNLACMRSLFKFRAAGMAFTGDMAKAATSDKIRVEEHVRKVLIRHTVSASTAPTQSSSTMQALVTLGIVTASGGTKNPTYTLTDHPSVAKLEKDLMKAA